jgi:LmbE family N-acetylglucosaminyl deacetylase
MAWVVPNVLFPETLFVVVPHMDDCVLGCGGTIAKISHKQRIHLVYATDGMKSPEPLFAWHDKVTSDLGKVRMQEARDAMGYLGVPKENIHFLVLPEGRLSRHFETLSNLILDLIRRCEPATVLAPFRYDRHGDHITLNHVLTRLYQQEIGKFKLVEYFVYYRWRLLPKGDVRKYIRPEYLSQIDISDVSAKKRAALDFFKSQTTQFYPWQTRANLTPQLLDSVSQNPEFFLQFDPSLPGSAIFYRRSGWIRVAHRLEPFLKRKKDKFVELLSRGVPRYDPVSE